MNRATRSVAVLLVTLFHAGGPALALDFPLSDTAVRSAYFLGQRYKGASGLFLEAYTKHLPAPKTGPYIETIQFLSPFAQLVREYSARVADYSAQQAELDHRGKDDNVVITVKIFLTPTYSRILSPNEVSEPAAGDGANLRPSTFWKTFEFRVFDDESIREPLAVSGKGNSSCDKYGNCILIGATVHLEFPASAFSSQHATVEVAEPDGQTVHADFDLPSLR